MICPCAEALQHEGLFGFLYNCEFLFDALQCDFISVDHIYKDRFGNKQVQATRRLPGEIRAITVEGALNLE